MAGRQPFLALAIKGVIGADGSLLASDAQLRRLHIENGGEEGGVLAVPGLLELAMLAWRTGIRLERAVFVADGEHDLELWVEAIRKDATVSLSILGWHERGPKMASVRSLLPSGEVGYSGSAAPSLQIDASGTVIRATPALIAQLGSRWIGQRLDTHFALGENAGDSLSSLIGDQTAVERREAIHLDSGSRFALSLEPVRALAGEFLGYHAVLQPLVPGLSTAVVAPTTEPSSGLGFSKHFASAVRQPLSRIIANAETIGAQVNGPLKPNYAGYAQDIASAARHLSDLVGDLEDLDAIDRTDFKVAREPVELGDIARRVAGLLALKAADHHIDLILPAADIQAPAVGEFRRVLQILLNLVGNAIRYAPDGSKVTISLDPDVPSISVEDQGAGIKQDDRERIFSKFERLGRSGDGGSGLGLYISRRLARAMKGDLTVDESSGGGARFTLHLPPA